jgi:chromate transporter
VRERAAEAFDLSRTAQLRLWTGVAVQSFGGGQTTRLLLYQHLVEERRWVRPEEFTETWGLCQLAPGINLVAMAALLGWRLGGPTGVAIAVAGLVVPSALLTILFTVLYAATARFRWMPSALHGITAGVAGMGVVMSLRLVRPSLEASWKEGWTSLLASVAVLLAAIAAFLLARLPVAVILVGAGAALAALNWLRRLAGR